MTTRNMWRLVEQLVPGDKLISLQAWKLGANIDAIAARSNVRGEILATEIDIVGNVRITVRVGRTTITRQYRPGATFPIEIQSHDVDNVLPNVGATDDNKSTTQLAKEA